MAQKAQIVGKVEYRGGDGPNVEIRPGPVKVTIGVNDATLSWIDEETHGSAAMPLADFKRYVAEGLIKLDR
ncbi:hypothetical protein [Hydrogenophaga sp. PBL-H3]|uniref:hypothetical protein n=1 Tax=Hydrogenophaga sp. PBL-H3 TaxID=434010 RepID=UPI00131FEED9|nr:hypothetical protein [Hydrogenophaga sp. PBL-H3]QHE76895.1 hypothetical protein F9Z45_12955 [Hydrogenophaga sp. PBL-H3]QHE81319.1 hypothetical protein F9Z44_12955 [Hydrogenophaga sp. PBL-H3]